LASTSKGENEKHEGGGLQGRAHGWPRVERVFAVIGAVAALIAIVSVVVIGVKHTSYFEERSEEQMVSQLNPGDDLARIEQIIGSVPDFQETVHRNLQVYVFDRKWEYIQLLVNSANTVLSVGIYAKTVSFTATLPDGVVVNGPPIRQQLRHQPLLGSVGATASCGSWADFYEGYREAMPGNLRSIIFGDMSGTDGDNQSNWNGCSVVSSGNRCVPHLLPIPGLDISFLKCLESSKSWTSIQNNAPSAVVIVTAPGQPIIPEMLNQDYFAEHVPH
jgi:hypothetical protein